MTFVDYFLEKLSAFGLDDGHWEAGLLERESGRQFESARGLKNNADVGRLGGECPEGLAQLAVATRRVGRAERQVGGQMPEVERCLRDVDPNEDGGHRAPRGKGSEETTARRPNSSW